jgi:hypothetical protein
VLARPSEPSKNSVLIAPEPGRDTKTATRGY